MNYKIKRGDNLWNLAKRYGTTVEQLARLNGIKNPNMIREGAGLFIPGNLEPPPAPRQALPEIVETNLALAPQGQPARQPRDPTVDAITPSGFLGGDPVSEVLAGIGGAAFTGKQLGRAAGLGADAAAMRRVPTNNFTLDDLYAVAKYMKPEQATKLVQQMGRRR